MGVPSAAATVASRRAVTVAPPGSGMLGAKDAVLVAES
jgi:hypothetical protein